MDCYGMVIADLQRRRALVQAAIEAIEVLRPDLIVCTIHLGRPALIPNESKADG